MHRILTTLSLFSTLAFAPLAQATQVSLSPVLLTVDAAHERATVLTVKNLDQQDVEFTAEVFSWSQQNGQDVLTPVRDVLINPPRVKVKPGETQLVRLALRVPAKGEQQTYRVILQQLPDTAQPPSPPTGQGSGSSDASQPTKATFKALFKFSVPLVVGRATAQPNNRVTVQRTPAGQQLSFSNTGTGYALYRNISYGTGDNQSSLGSVYVLAGSQMQLPLPTNLSGTLNLTYLDASGQERHETVAIPGS